MRCPSPCWTPMDPSGDRLQHTCPSCGKVCTLRDVGYVPAPGYTPSPLRVPADPFKPLESELGWSQDEADDFSASVPKRLMRAFPEKVCQRCIEVYTPKNGRQKWCTACAVAVRRETDTRRTTTDSVRPVAVRFTAKLLRGAA